MTNNKLITGQQITPHQIERLKELRRNMTPAETKLWHRLRANRLEGYHFRRQQLIEHYFVDFYCHQVGLVVEVDGGVHLTQEDYDHERDRCLSSFGLKVLHFTNTDVNQNIETVLSEILAACQEQ